MRARHRIMVHGGGLVAAVVVAAAVLRGDRGDEAPPAPRPASTYATTLAEMDAKIHWLETRAAAQRMTSWMAQADVAVAYGARARLTGDYEDYAVALRYMDRAFAIAPPGAGPFLERAGLHFTLHRLDVVEPDLAAAESAVVVDDPTRAAIIGLRADVMLQRGRLGEARRGFTAALQLHPTANALARWASWQWETGDLAAAAGSYRGAAVMSPGVAASQKAWLHLQLGLLALDAGRYETALRHDRDADAVFHGWWLVEEHIAEVLALQGHVGDAMHLYRALIRRTRNPELMDALARLLRGRGDDDEAERWIATSRAIHEARLARFPEAAWGHALEHFLAFGPSDRAVELAEKNFALRPNRNARAQLVRAYETAGRRTEAAQIAAGDP